VPNDTASSTDTSDLRRERREARGRSAVERIRALAAAHGLAGIVLTRPGPVAWASGGINPPIDRTAPVDTVWLVVTDSGLCVVTTGVEAPRIEAELLPPGASLVAVPWWDAAAFVTAAAAAAGAAPAELGSDGHAAFGHDVDHELASVRLPLSDAEQADLRALGSDAAGAVESALREWRPGESDRDIAARIAAACERAGADAPCLLVGGDERLESFRHPVADGSRPRRAVMAVLVARRDGLHVALTRHAATETSAALDRGLAACRAIHRRVLAACRPGATYGDALTALAAGYAEAAAPDGWRAHYQGGPIGFGQREFEISPAQRKSPWWDAEIEARVAVAWNPSLPGGAKDEDTYLLGPGGPDLVTTTGAWPQADDGDPVPRPAVLEAA
jgi:Xaa-Pro aminopeptidase